MRRFLRRIQRQTYPHWRLVVVHDGPNAEIEALVARYQSGESRIEFIHTRSPANDTGVSPRLEGARHALERNAPDYCVFWDDDNYFAADALLKIADALEATGRPDLLLVGMGYGPRVVPPPGIPIAALEIGQVDTASLVLRPQLAFAAYEDVLRQLATSPEKVLFYSDYLAFEFVRLLDPAPRIEVASDVVIGFHDGLRWNPYIRHMLGIPPLGLAKRPWFRALTFGMFKSR